MSRNQASIRPVFHYRVASHGDREMVVVEVAGEVDGAAATDLTAAVADAAREAEGDVVLDVSSVAYAGSAFVRALIEGRHCARQHDLEWRVEDATPAVRRVIELCDARTLLEGEPERVTVRH